MITDDDFQLFEKVKKTVASKDNDYGEFYNHYSQELITANIFNKANRLINLVYSGKEPNHESIDDTILDLAGYCCLLDNYRRKYVKK